MGRPQVSVVKRQREQAKRERKQQKAERRAQRKSEKLEEVANLSSPGDDAEAHPEVEGENAPAE